MRETQHGTPPTLTCSVKKRKYRSLETSASVRLWRSSRERGPLIPSWGIVLRASARSRRPGRRRLLEVVEIGVERRDHDALVVGDLEDRAVADHLSVLVAERRVPDLADLEPEHVVREDPVGRRAARPGPEAPLAKRRGVPDADVGADRVVLGDGVAEVLGPVPALPVDELAAQLALEAVEGGADDVVTHAGLHQPSCDWFKREVRRRSPALRRCAPPARAAADRRLHRVGVEAGGRPLDAEDRDELARLPRTGAATAFSSSSRSPSRCAQPRSAPRRSRRSSARRSVIVRSA